MTLDEMKIFVGVEQKKSEDVAGVAKDDGTVGAYGFPRWHWDRQDGIPSHLKGDTPLMRFKTGEGFHTSRSITCYNHRVYTVTRNTFYVHDERGNQQVAEKPLLDFFTEEKQKSEAERIINQSSLKAGVVPIPPKGLLFNLYLKGSDSPEKTTRSLVDSYLFYSSSGELNDFKPIGDVALSGCPILLHDHTIILPHQKTLERLVHSKGKYSKDEDWVLPPLEREILALSASGELALCTDSLRGYTLVDLKRREAYPSTRDWKHFKHQILPSEAASCALTDHNGKKYALFGCDGGKLLVYKVLQNKDSWGLEYLKTITFLSLESSIKDIGKDNHIYGVKVDSLDYVHFTLRNLYLCLGMPTIAEDPKSSKREITIIPATEEKKEPLEYVKALLKTYSLEQVCWVPHRVSSYDFFGT